ncbi:MaoC family dehydratase N-terminal domain-containing protein [Bradyrhizobium brasilense]|uniref:FAS1-like dehydratase domain-containing protein n=1 Tax=Bradyrhizobium brasilense TaxID=1419277 RepID=UPI0024B24D84|nr:MaoC family dehydratase N-terminal domain-containing protein [Bradyrhizobium australafricanum]WFU31417.1 MaoC family dehydratase N-terminal domain-containing protein [Bradyrhizobium australafricanum]
MALLTDELRSWIGREVHYPAREELGRASIRYFALVLGDENPLYLDEAYAREAGYPSVIAPPTLVCETCQYAHRGPGENGYIGHEWQLPVADCRMIRAGNEYQFMRPVLPEDRICVTWTLEDIVECASSRGGTQLFVSSLARYTDASGEVVAINRETIVYQPMGHA